MPRGSNFTDLRLQHSLDNRDAHIGRLNEKLGAASKVIEVVRTVLHLQKNKSITLDPDTERELTEALAAFDKLEEQNKATLARMQGKKTGLPGRAP